MAEIVRRGKLLEEARAAFDRLINTTQQVDEVRLALLGKAMTLTLQADRVEKDAARVKVLRAEAEKIQAQADAVRKRK